MPAVNLTILGRSITFDPKIVAPAALDEAVFPRISSLAIDVSGSCNLKCIYCAESATMPPRQPIDPTILNRSVDFLFALSQKGCAVSLHLGSGEPLLYPESVRTMGVRARELAKLQNRKLSMYLTTNGTLLSAEIASWLIVDGWNVKVSLDGDQRIHDSQRVDKVGMGTYRTIEAVVRKLAMEIPDRFSTTSVLCHGTDPAVVFYSVASMGVKRIELVPVASSQSSKLALRKEDLDAYKRFIFDYVKRVAKGDEVSVHIRLYNRIRKVLGYGNTQTPCGAGRTFFASDAKGDIYPCFRFVGLSKYRLGDLQGIDPERVRCYINDSGRSYEHRTECVDCWAAPLCGGPCFACADFFGSGSALPEYCEIVRSESEAALWLVDYLREKNMPRLLQLLGVEYLEG